MSDRIEWMFFRHPPEIVCWLAKLITFPIWLVAVLIGLVLQMICWTAKEGFLWGRELSNNLLRGVVTT